MMKYGIRDTYLRGWILGLIFVSLSYAEAEKWSEEVKYFVEDRSIFEKKRRSNPSDWLAHHKETGQTYLQFLSSKPNFPDKQRNVLYVLPLGEFDKDSPSLNELQRYMESYYMPMKVVFKEPIQADEVKVKSRLNSGQLQWKSGDILNWMRHNVPKDAYGMLAVTMTDLYPDEKWNFVFGQASYRSRVGVFSFARYGADDQKTELLRASKVLTHEMGHMFGIKHCTFYQCNMNGANHLKEMDNTPPHLCPVCLRKLHRSVGFSPGKRYEELKKFYLKHDMEEASAWVEKRLAE